MHQAIAAGRPQNNLFSPNMPMRTVAAETWNDGKRLGRSLFHRMLQKLLRLLGCSDPLSSSQARLLSRKAADELFQQLRAMESSGSTGPSQREADGRDDEDSTVTVSPMRLVPLLRKAEGEFRRSFDSRCSQTALGVLFWRREDAPPKVAQSESSSPSKPKSNPRGGAASNTAVVFGLPTSRDGDLAELLGSAASSPSNKAPGQSLGRFHSEQWQGGADGVAVALNSPLRRASSVNNRKVRLDKDSAPTLHSQPNLFDSKEFLRGGQVRELILRGGREEPPPPPSPQQRRRESSRQTEGDVARIFRGRPHTLRQEFANDRTAVSDALGCNRQSPGW